nr:MAG TPA: hypothetical protein [Caudoviricetes sp.]
MSRIKDYTAASTIGASEKMLLDGSNGTKSITAENLAKALLGYSLKRLPAQSLTASGGTLTFKDASITTTSLIDVYATIPNIAPSSIVASAGKCVVTFDAQESAFDVCITIRN